MLNKQYATVIEKEFFSVNLDENKLFDGSNDSDYVCNSISISEDPFLKWWKYKLDKFDKFDKFDKLDKLEFDIIYSLIYNVILFFKLWAN